MTRIIRLRSLATAFALIVALGAALPAAAQSQGVNDMTGGGDPDRFDCDSPAVPTHKGWCNKRIERIPGVPEFSCAKPSGYDQSNFCGAVYGYESHWCDRIRSSALKAECKARTE